ncbi:hypothetical protein AVEN_171200-1 [Araneus ventricosus]|uniref:Uncharacterized protein n=1 Tax=Araneus ventricosus TaxID=182803 RepID=A0A4Y2JD14_ARAVE|nr:hypothetical protein AVEN_171200-1 [Araneus ventricosus]
MRDKRISCMRAPAGRLNVSPLLKCIKWFNGAKYTIGSPNIEPIRSPETKSKTPYTQVVFIDFKEPSCQIEIAFGRDCVTKKFTDRKKNCRMVELKQEFASLGHLTGLLFKNSLSSKFPFCFFLRRIHSFPQHLDKENNKRCYQSNT